MPTLRSSRLSSSVRPIGASGWVRLGIRLSRWVISASSRRSRSSSLGHRRLEPLAFVDQRGPLLGVALAAGGLGHLVLPAADFLDRLEQAPALGLERDDAVDVSSTSGGALRLRQFCLTASALATTNFRSSMGIPLARLAQTLRADMPHVGSCAVARSVWLRLVGGSQHPTRSASSSSRWALALMPRWKSASENFSLGPWRLSSFWPQPRSRVSTPRCCLISPTTGIEPPSRMKTGLVPKPASTARTAARTPGRVDIDQDGRRPVVGDDLVGHAGRADPARRAPGTAARPSWGPGRGPGGS